MSGLYDKWKESVVTVYDSQEKSTLELLEDITSFNDEIAKEIDNKTNVNGDHKGTWQGLNKPTLSDEGMRSTVEKLDKDLKQVNSQLEQIKTESFNSTYSSSSTKPYVLFIDDDARNEFLIKLKPIFDANNIKCSIAVNPIRIINKLTNAMSIAELKQLQSEGYEIVNHGYEHKGLDGKTETERKKEVIDSRNWLKENGLNGYDYFVLPDGTPVNKTEPTFEFLKRNVKCALNTTALDGESKINTIPLEQFSLTRVHTPNETLENMKSYVDDIKNKNGVLIFFTHAWQEILTNEKISELDQLIKYIKQKNIDIINIEKLVNFCGNVVDTNVGKNGIKISKTGIDNFKNVFIKNFSGDFNKPITSYPIGITVECVSKTDAVNSPSSASGGELITFRNNIQSSYCFQLYYANGIDGFWKRRVISDNTYSDFENYTKANLIIANATGIDTKTINDYVIGTVKIEACSRSTSVLPDNTSGVMKTYRISSQNIYCYREFMPIGSNKIYKSWCNEDGTFGAFL